MPSYPAPGTQDWSDDLKDYIDGQDATTLAAANTHADNADATLQSNIDAKVGVVNGKTPTAGAVSLTASDVGAAPTAHTHDWTNDITGKPTLDGISDGTTYKRMTATEKTKLSGIATGATAYTDSAAVAAVVADGRFPTLDGDNDFTGTVTFPAGSIDPVVLANLDPILNAWAEANRKVSFRTYEDGTTPPITPGTVWAKLGVGVTPTPADTHITHQGSTLDQATYTFDPGTIPAASVYTLVIAGGYTGTTSAPAPVATDVAGRSLTWAPIEDTPRTKTDGVTTLGSATVTSATMNFTVADIGKLIMGTGIPTGAYIAAVASTTSITISANATSSGTGRTLTIAGAHQSNGTNSLVAYRATGTPDSSGNITITFPVAMTGCVIQLVATSSVNATPVRAAYNGYSSSFTSPHVDLGTAPNSGHHQFAALSVNSGSTTISVDPGTTFGTSPDVTISSPSMKTRMSVLGTPTQDPTWTQSASAQGVAFTVVYQPG